MLLVVAKRMIAIIKEVMYLLMVMSKVKYKVAAIAMAKSKVIIVLIINSVKAPITLVAIGFIIKVK